ncbi:hypothetical protein MUU47_10675 [Scandinavium sp. H11S7]|uniref:Uncharacterized protein n=1 Tax=Scandinavium hiltneri TaxID=2926519 RepID=A0ABT2E107_9ENTR|nr:hypothetical protein [Scandinavium hiltneri]MCS2161574.1 hypothetical protein [Scandinavium hiltneri]
MKDLQIRMPFIEGTIPNKLETMMGVKNLYHKDFMIGDPKPANFIKKATGEVAPIDFGLVFLKGNIRDIHMEVKREIVKDYIKGGHSFIPQEIKKEYTTAIFSLYPASAQIT